jgi:predicted RNA binding protein YcfA (HicA-like mRNA interferase family)
LKLPRNLSGEELAAKLVVLGYRISRQRGDHLRLTTNREGQHHVTLPRHDPLKVGTLSGILTDIAAHFAFTREEILRRLFAE